MTLPKYLSYREDNCFSFFLKFVLLQFKFIPAEFKNSRTFGSKKPTPNGQTETYFRFLCFYVFMYLCLPI